MGWFSDAWEGVTSFAGNAIGIHSGIGAEVPGPGPVPWGIGKLERGAQKQLAHRINLLRDAYERAQGRTGELSAANAQAISDSAVQREGSLVSRLASSGLLGGSVAPNLARGIEADRVRMLQENNADIAQRRIGLDIAGGSAVADATADLAFNMAGRADRQRSFYLNREGLRLGRDQFVSSSRQDRAARIGDTVNSYVGMGLGMMGGGGGAAAGGLGRNPAIFGGGF